MKRISLFSVLSVVVLVFFISCNVEPVPIGNTEHQDINTVKFSIIAPEKIVEHTKSYYDDGGNVFLWASTDTLGIYPDKGNQVYFVIGEDGADQGTASFDGGGWAFKSGSIYYSYFPFIPDYYLDRQSIPVSYTGQVQPDKTSVRHISRYLYSYTGATSADEGTLNFVYYQLGCIINPVISGIDGKFVSMSIHTEDDIIAAKGHFNLLEPDVTSVKITGDEMTDRLSIKLLDYEVTEGETANIYMAVPPIAAGGKKLLIELTDDSGKVWTCEKNPISSDFKKAQVRVLTCGGPWTQTGIGVEEASESAVDGAMANLASDAAINTIIVSSAPEEDLTVEIPAISSEREITLVFPEEEETDAAITINVSNENQAPAKLNLTAPVHSSININTPTSTVCLSGQFYEKISSSTAQNTLVIGGDVEIETLELVKGGLHVYGVINVLDLSHFNMDSDSINIVNEGKINKVVGYGGVSAKVRFFDGSGKEMFVDAKGRLNYGGIEAGISDSVFRKYCLDNFDSDGDGCLSQGEVDDVTLIDVSTENIETLSGIELFSNLTHLYCEGSSSWDNQNDAPITTGLLTDLDISRNLKLQCLSCKANKLENLDLIHNSNLRELDCSYNAISTIDLSENALLWKIHCEVNQIDSLDLSKNGLLTECYCYRNILHSLSVANNPGLQYLECEINQIENLDIRGALKLEHLCCHMNKLTKLDVSENIILYELKCNDNEIDELDLTKNYLLRNIDCSVNKISEIDLSNNANLVELHCEGNLLSTLDVSNNPKLSTLVCWDSYLLSEIWLAEDQSINTFLYDSGTTTIKYKQGQQDIETNIIDSSFRKYCIESFDTDEDGHISQFEASAVTSLEVMTGNIETLAGIEYFPYLEELRCRPFSYATYSDDGIFHYYDSSGEETFCNKGMLRELDISSNKLLRYLDCSNNQIQELDVSNCPELLCLYCTDNQIEELDLANNRNLITLWCIGNKLTSLDIKYNQNIGLIYCQNNLIDAIEFGNNECLGTLDCFDNKLNTLDVQKLPSLTRLNCHDNLLTNLNLGSNSKLYEFNCANNQLSFIDLSKNDDLEYFWCYGNPELFNVVIPKDINEMVVFEFNPDITLINGKGSAIDLGLSVKWSNCNVGASSAFDEGELFAWGECSKKEEYTFENYKFGLQILYKPGDIKQYTKYVTDKQYASLPDGKETLEDNDDAAVKWLDNWRMPTAEEQHELLDNCTWYWTERGGNTGYVVTSKINGKSIFFPSDSRYNNGTGNYWTSTLAKGTTIVDVATGKVISDGGGPNAYMLHFNAGEFGFSSGARFFGAFVRPVWEEN